MLDFYKSFLCIREVQVPIVTAIEGYAIGAGACLALATDLRVMGADAKIGFNFVKLGEDGVDHTCMHVMPLCSEKVIVWAFISEEVQVGFSLIKCFTAHVQFWKILNTHFFLSEPSPFFVVKPNRNTQRDGWLSLFTHCSWRGQRHGNSPDRTNIERSRSR